MTTYVPFEEFREEWLSDVRDSDPSTVELGRRFARKLTTQWLDINDISEDFYDCDGAGDGGIDIACLVRGGNSTDSESPVDGDTWYLIQSKYGSAFSGSDTLLCEGQKILDTLDGHREKLSSVSSNVLEMLLSFRRAASDKDRIVLVFATEYMLNEDEKRVMNDLRAMGRNRLGSILDVESVSIQMIFQRLQDAEPLEEATTVPIEAKLSKSGDDLLVGAIPLLCLYDFLKVFRSTTGDLDQLYEKNVRRFLGSRKKVNRGIQQTLRETPQKFGLYNNGITIVVEDFECRGDSYIDLKEPYIVNGCQTTRTIWEVFHQKLEAGGTGNDPQLEIWKSAAKQGVVITKIVKIGKENEKSLGEITRYTNSQNAISEKDFLALTNDFRTWAKQMEDRYSVFLEIQRGGWDSRKAYQKQHLDATVFTECANAFDLLKVYGSGWLREPGRAFGSNSDFAPDGVIFKRIMDNGEGIVSFGVDYLYAAYLLHKAASQYGFGRGAVQISRRQTRYLFYFVVMDLLWDVLMRQEMDYSLTNWTRALLALFNPGNESAIESLLNEAVNLIDEYMRIDAEECVFKEPNYRRSNDLNAYLKSDQLGKSQDYSPFLISLLQSYKKIMGRTSQDGSCPRKQIAEAIRNADSAVSSL